MRRSRGERRSAPRLQGIRPPNGYRGDRKTRRGRRLARDAPPPVNMRCRPAAKPQRRDLPRAAMSREDQYPAAARSSSHLKLISSEKNGGAKEVSKGSAARIRLSCFALLAM